MKISKAIIVTATFSILSVVFLFTACKKDSSSSSSSGDETDAASLSASSATADNQYDDVLTVALQPGSDGSASSAYTPGVSSGTVEVNDVKTVTGPAGITSCAVITASPADTVSYPKTITVDFGTGCTGIDGVTRKGKITYVFSGKILAPGTTVSATFTGYSVNSYQLAGAYSITNNSTSNGISFTTTISSGQITFPDASYYAYAGTKTLLQTGGAGTTDVSDNVYSITGSNTFSSSAGKTLTDSITTPLVWETSCKNIVSGIVGFTYGNNGVKLKGTLDYGSGDCDNTATIKVGATTKTVTLP
ncbi:MAG TPA: hypothetical protein VNS58_05510 [Puia sp.]|nr:hypothetical protein [Puia sp.]